VGQAPSRLSNSRASRMSLQGFSRTAIFAAICRAAHQIFDEDPKILQDPIALKCIDDAAQMALSNKDPTLMAMVTPAQRAHFCLRSRIVEDCLERAVANGVNQYVVLGAGLDSFAYRQPDWARTIKIVEVDHPRTQEFKIELIRAKALGPPENVVYLPVDFASETVIGRLTQASINVARPIFVSWLGVTQYLVPDAVSDVLRALASWPGGCGLLVTYMLADWSDFDPPTVERYKRQRDRAASLGEPWINGYSEATMAAGLRSAGFAFQKSFAVSDIQSLYFARRTDGLRAEGGPSRLMGAHTSWDGEQWFNLGSP
jgi:methyltransferase (TIGR00027 family)